MPGDDDNNNKAKTARMIAECGSNEDPAVAGDNDGDCIHHDSAELVCDAGDDGNCGAAGVAQTADMVTKNRDHDQHDVNTQVSDVASKHHARRLERPTVRKQEQIHRGYEDEAEGVEEGGEEIKRTSTTATHGPGRSKKKDLYDDDDDDDDRKGGERLNHRAARRSEQVRGRSNEESCIDSEEEEEEELERTIQPGAIHVVPSWMGVGGRGGGNGATSAAREDADASFDGRINYYANDTVLDFDIEEANGNTSVVGRTEEGEGPLNTITTPAATSATTQEPILEAELVSESETVVLERVREAIIQAAPEAYAVIKNPDEDSGSKEDGSDDGEWSCLKRRSNNSMMVVGGVTVSLAVALGVGLGLGLQQQQAPAEPAGSQTTNRAPTLQPSVGPTAIPSSDTSNTELYSILQSNGILPNLNAVIAEKNESIPEYRAYKWMTTADTFLDDDTMVEDWEVIQRFVVATLYYAWTRDGSFQDLNNVFLTPDSVCDWNGKYHGSDEEGHGIFCESGVSGDGINETNMEDVGRVTRIELSDNNLSGRIHSLLGQLTALRTLRLSSNRIDGRLPEDLFHQLTQLQYLSLSVNAISGPIPYSVGSLTNLEQLELDENLLASTIPDSISNLSSALFISLHENSITGTIPPDIGNLSQLDMLYLNNNGLTGTIATTVGRLSSMRAFEVQANSIGGPIPSELGMIQNLSTKEEEKGFSSSWTRLRV